MHADEDLGRKLGKAGRQQMLQEPNVVEPGPCNPAAQALYSPVDGKVMRYSPGFAWAPEARKRKIPPTRAQVHGTRFAQAPTWRFMGSCKKGCK